MPLTTTFIRDITDVRHPINVCSLNEPGNFRFVSATTVSVGARDRLDETLASLDVLDLRTGKRRTLVSWSQALIHVPPENSAYSANLMGAYDISADGLSVAYAMITGPPGTGGIYKAAVFHLSVNGSDRMLATVPPPVNGGEMQVEFAPSGKYVAFGMLGLTGTKAGAPVQVWSLDGRLIFSSTGSNSITWGAGDQLYFDDGTNLMRWSPSGSSSLILAGRWSNPSMSTDRHYVAYCCGANSTIAVVNTASGVVTRLPGANTEPAFLTPTLMFHRYSPHPVIGNGEARVYDVADGTDVASPIDHVFGTWPRATPREHALGG